MKTKSQRKSKKLIILLIIFSVLLIAGGGTLAYISSPSYISKTTIKEFGKKAAELINNRTETGLEDNYKRTGAIKFNLRSDYFQALAPMSSSYTMISNLLTNLSNTENNIVIIQDKQNKKLFLNFDSKLAGQNLINTKYLVENATAYYSIDGITNTYVNNGNNNYFESLNSSTTTNENIEYIIEKVTEAMINNLEKDYLSASYTDQYKIVTITLTERDLVTYGNKIINALKKDKKANQIMTGYNANFTSSKLTEKEVSGIGTLKLNIYLDKLLSKVKSYEIELENGNRIIYSSENGQEIIEIKTKEETIMLEIKKQGEKTEIEVKDGKNTHLGNVVISRTNTNYDIVANITSQEISMNFGYNYQINNLKKGKEYSSNTLLTMKMTAQNTIIFDGTITVTTQTTNDTTINEDTSKSILASSLTETQKDLLQQKISLITLSLMS